MLRLRTISLLAIVACCATSAHAQLPAVTLSAVSPNGGKNGTTFDVTLTGIVDGDGVDRLMFSHPGITAKAAEQPSAIFTGKNIPVANKFAVTIGPDVPPGVYDLRAVGTFGVSNPRAFAVDPWNEVAEPAGNQSADKAATIELGSVVNGTTAANSSDWFRFTAKKGTRVLIDCNAQRLDGKLDGTLVLHDPQLKELARSRDVNRRDPLIDVTIPADGDYLLKLYDFTYGGGPDYFYRLAVHAGPYIDFVFPPAVKPGVKNKLTVYGRNLPGAKPAEGTAVQGRPLEKLEIDLDVPADEKLDARAVPTVATASELFVDGREYRLKSSAGRTNGILLGYATEQVVVEQEPNDDPGQQVTTPCEIAGQFAKRGDLDAFTFDAKKGETLAIEVVAQRMGFKTDPIVLVQQGTPSADGKLAWGDLKEIDDEAKNPLGPMLDGASNDAAYAFAAPADGKFRVVLRDLYGDSRGDPRLIYRLILRKPKPDYRLAAFWNSQAGAKNFNDLREFKPSGQWIRPGDVAVFTVFAARQDGFAGPIRLRCEGLPAGATAAEAVIPAGQDSAALSIAVAENAPAWTGTVRIIGQAKVDGNDVSRAARMPTITAAGAQKKPAEARLAQELTLSIGGAEQFPATVLLGDGKLVETKQGTKIEIPVRVARRGDFKEQLTLAAAALPANVKAANVVVAPGAKEGKLVVEPAANAPVGEFTIYLNTQVKINYERDKSGTASAMKSKQDMEKAVADLTTAVAEAKKAAAAAPKDKKADADKKVVEADARQKAAAAELKSAKPPPTPNKKRPRPKPSPTIRWHRRTWF
ncbi:MAG: PPC domain-containing protein [Pirellulales bacterium]